MAYKILEKIRLNSVVWKMVINAPAVAVNAKAGQFVIVKLDNFGERVPLTISEADRDAGTITIIFQEAGTTTRKLACLATGDSLMDLLGPLGHATDFGCVGKVVLVAGGVGIAEILPIAKYARSNDNHVVTIIGGRAKEFIILEKELAAYSDRLIIVTDDGSSGLKGLVTGPLTEALKVEKFDLCYSVGPDIMMKAVSLATKPFGLKTIVSLDANMVDGTGMCGTCRVTVGGEIKFACVDGPEFDAHMVDWDEFLKRQKRFKAEEARSLEMHNAHHKNCMYKG